VEGPVHRYHPMDGRLNRRSFIVGVPDPGVKERRVPLDFEEGQVRGGVDHCLEQSSHHVLRVGQARSMQAHEGRVAPGISDHQESSTHGHVGMIPPPSRGKRWRR
jgi:hypothetical protein